MKAVIRSNAFVYSAAIVVSLFAVGAAAAQSRKSIQLNENAFAFASQLIKGGHLIADGKGAWREHKRSPGAENEFISVHGFAEYAKWHLAEDKRYAVNTKGRYKFPYGDFTNVHRCGLLAAKARARQYRYAEIEHAAAELERLIEKSKSGASAPHSKTWP